MVWLVKGLCSECSRSIPALSSPNYGTYIRSQRGRSVALPAIWAFENRAGKDIWADMGDYWGLSGNKEKTRYFHGRPVIDFQS